MADKTISHEDYLKLLGLAVLSNEHRKAHQAIERAIAGLVGEEDEGGGYYGVVSDEIYSLDGFDAAGMLRRLDITVEEA